MQGGCSAGDRGPAPGELAGEVGGVRVDAVLAGPAHVDRMLVVER